MPKIGFKHIKLAFSLTETIILLTVFAVAIAAATPIISRKIVNIADAGSTLTGFAHGRYEMYSKEILTFGSDSYLKTIDPSNPVNNHSVGADVNGIVVFRRLYDDEYIKLTNTIPTLSKNGKYKSTIYEQIKNATPIRNSNGEIEFVEFSKNGKNQKLPIGGNIIIESANLIYKKGCLNSSSSPMQFALKGSKYKDSSGNEVTCNIDTDTLPNKDFRIIEGNLTKNYYPKGSGSKLDDDKNPLWHIEVTPGSDSNPAFEGKDVSIPWESVYSSNKLIDDGPIAPSDEDGDGVDEYVGTFDPGEKAINVVVHAVGGGGAGGGIKNAYRAISPKNATNKELQEMKKELADRFNKITGAGISADRLVRIESERSLYNRKYKDMFTSGDNYIVLNKHDGTISVKVDVRSNKGYQVFPNQLLQYTKIVGSQTQKPEIYNMPLWGNFDTIWERGFRASIAGCGAAGGAGPVYKVDTSTTALHSKQEYYAGLDGEPVDSEVCCEEHAPRVGCCCNPYMGTCCDDFNRNCHSCQRCGGTYTKCCCGLKILIRKCYYHCGGPHYNCGHIKTLQAHIHAGQIIGDCPSSSGDFHSGSCSHEIKGGAGGIGGACAVACTRVKAPVYSDIFCDKEGDGSPGVASPSTVSYGGRVSVSSGTKGRTCAMYSGNSTAMSTGGMGGMPCQQRLYGVKAADAGALDGLSPDVIADASSAYLNGARGEIPASQGGNQSATYEQAFLAYNALNISGRVGAELNGTPYVAETTIGIIGNMLAFRQGLLGVSGLRLTTVNLPDEPFLTGGDSKLKCESSRTCGANGANGTSYGMCDDFTGIDFTHGAYSNHIYAWTVPYTYNQLVYGEAGEAGEYKSVKIAKVTDKIKITLGLGGVWKEPLPSVTPAWEKESKGPNGTDTVIKVGSKKVLVAKGGKGGGQSQKTSKYDLCYPINSSDYGKKTYKGVEVGVCRQADNLDNKVGCCNGERGTRSTKDIVSTALNLSAFENIKSLVGNSLIIGIGVGRGGEGAGTRAGWEEVGSTRTFNNITGRGVEFSASSIFQPYTNQIIDIGPAAVGDTEYDNTTVIPSAHNFRGGDGAVIIAW